MDNITAPLNGKLIIALSRALQAIHRESEVLFRQHGLTVAQFAVLEALLNKGDLTVGMLVKAVLSSNGNMTVVISNLERRGWVWRTTNPTDHRSYLIGLTDSGRALIGEVFARHMILVEQALTPLSTTEKETVITILQKLR